MTSHGSPSLSSTARHPMHVLFFLVNLAIIPNPPEEVTTVLERVWLPSGKREEEREMGVKRQDGDEVCREEIGQSPSMKTHHQTSLTV